MKQNERKRRRRRQIEAEMAPEPAAGAGFVVVISILPAHRSLKKFGRALLNANTTRVAAALAFRRSILVARSRRSDDSLDRRHHPLFAPTRAERGDEADCGGQDRHDDDCEDDEREVVFHGRNLAEEVARRDPDADPDQRAEDVIRKNHGVVHAADAGDEPLVAAITRGRLHAVVDGGVLDADEAARAQQVGRLADPVARVKILSAAAKNIATLSRASVNQKTHAIEVRGKATAAASARSMDITTEENAP